LSDILQAIVFIEQFTTSTPTYNEYIADIKTQSAVERQLGIIGEAVNKLNILFPDLNIDHSKKIIGFRNRLIHSYDAVDSTIIWTIINKYLPLLKKDVKKTLK